ncbi:type IV pili twitching motility protein PilT [Candidatus Jorgensenbacteria bacterium CG03_land_8_20_14_0_80_38_39]|uniref:Type IV pili twitching motility protein PilT n=1 Tax=Candidatus Jorgensenbacteria bacterium CG11_big_fil_rev_8_21_14_0_20_38_23 TaxID=1974594 RepID=A0A2H0NB34_9BACT|nr:MAG: type IV pili twitching motility protein PilT [Candidatus Jorgensenbacteria bacterium CG11_big_fil_rev_8_21_14_0_20_38_23]PIV13317.1 MAG: type IV pili twitching motility protein PilT [Candidatus Jorgensenbacteria bacterium CG03_land_8_20_14_0_80_38_39]PJA94879.1 MAG: type IV pili twitching motility protein PilT [Candidatus Jorgensenbacteria bacterium CG_4_9_14_3_um_filter_38_10]
MMDYKQKLNDLMLTAAKQNASDLHLAVGRRPIIRLDGVLIPLVKELILTKEDAEGLVFAFLTDEQKQNFLKLKQLDFSYNFEDKVRFRVNVYMQRGFMAVAMRLIPAQIKTIEELKLPPILHDFARLQQGFILVVGPAGHGKSTTLAAILDEINHKRTEHIITVEDPIEYIFSQDRCVISQREVGRDTLSFHSALRSILRQDPDVIMIGEIRDPETMATAMTAAETGHLVFSTLHTNSAAQTIDRIIDSFPPNQQGQIVSQLASTLVAIVSERLIPRLGGGRVPATEIMLVNAAVRNLIRERKVYQIDLVIETSVQEGMLSLNRSLVSLIKQKEVSLEQAEGLSLNPSELRILLQKS